MHKIRLVSPLLVSRLRQRDLYYKQLWIIWSNRKSKSQGKYCWKLQTTRSDPRKQLRGSMPSQAWLNGLCVEPGLFDEVLASCFEKCPGRVGYSSDFRLHALEFTWNRFLHLVAGRNNSFGSGFKNLISLSLFYISLQQSSQKLLRDFCRFATTQIANIVTFWKKIGLATKPGQNRQKKTKKRSFVSVCRSETKFNHLNFQVLKLSNINTGR